MQCAAAPLQVLLAERQQRAAVNRRCKLAEDALLDGINAQLRNGELVDHPQAHSEGVLPCLSTLLLPRYYLG